MTGTTGVRRADADDLLAAGRLRWRWQAGPDDGEEDAFLDAWTTWAAASEAHTCFVAVEGDEVVGLAWLAVAARVPTPSAHDRATGDVQSVYVVPEARGAGHARRLVDALLEEAWARGLDRVTVHSNEEGVGVYRRAGFASWSHLMAVSRPTPTAGA